MDRRNFLQALPVIAAIPFVKTLSGPQIFWATQSLKITSPYIYNGTGFTVIAQSEASFKKLLNAGF
jgi:hypothetical protein